MRADFIRLLGEIQSNPLSVLALGKYLIAGFAIKGCWIRLGAMKE
jgi:hypothetical protein